MKKLRFIVLIALLALVSFVGRAVAADGDELTTTSFRINSDGQVIEKNLIETATTSDTVTAAETGKTFLVNYKAGSITFTLPTAADGLNYKFVAINGNKVAGNKGAIYLDPQDTDTFIGCVTSDTTSSFTAGDRIKSPGATGDSVSIVGTTLYWICTESKNVWADAN